ncbi:MAG: hypothetical protein JWQ43_3710 [Glaciihabitans sp.]|nr:hypothetical protein [Glaciihabitans sp.]
MVNTRTNGLSIFAVLGIAGLILSGCSSTPDAETTAASPAPVVEEQSVEDACTTLIAGVTEMETSIAESAAELQADPAAGDAAFKEFVDLFEENISQVTNAEVKATGDRIHDVFSQIGDARAVAASNPEDIDPDEMDAILVDLTAATDELTEVCGAA